MKKAAKPPTKFLRSKRPQAAGDPGKPSLRLCGERKKERNGRSFPHRGKLRRVEFLLTRGRTGFDGGAEAGIASGCA